MGNEARGGGDSHIKMLRGSSYLSEVQISRLEPLRVLKFKLTSVRIVAVPVKVGY